MSYHNNNSYNAGYQQGGYAQNNYNQPQHHQEPEYDDYYAQPNASAQWDSRSTKSSNTVHSYASQHNTKQPYSEQPPMPTPYQANPVVDYPPTTRVQFPGGFGGPQRTMTEASGFSSARDKLMKRRVSTDSRIDPLEPLGIHFFRPPICWLIY